MRRTYITIRAFILTAVAIACLLFCYALAHSPVFERGERYEFYKGSSSEEAVLSRTPYEKLLLQGVKGESARYTGDRAEEIIEQFQAEVLFTEKAAGVINYYCYSPVLGSAVCIGDKRVNLHIACNGEQTAAGTPVIFGGF